MRIKSFNQLFEKESSHLDYWYDHGYNSKNSKKSEKDDPKWNEFKSLCDIIEKMIKRSKIDNFSVTNRKSNIKIKFFMSDRERFSKVMCVLGVLKKLRTDILIQYNSIIKIEKGHDKKPKIVVDFIYNDEAKSTTESPS